MIFKLAKDSNFITDEYYSEAINLLDDYGLLSSIDDKFNKDEFYETMKSDKFKFNLYFIILPL